jgi:uncharacterized membrane protein YdjX (TVP38/TMEM64 family)
MSSTSTVAKRKIPVLPLLALVLIAGVATVFVLRGVNVHEVIERGIEMIRDLGAPAFFIAMTVLPAFGMPMLAFTLTAGEAFEAQLGRPLVLAISAASVALNLALGYWVARYALRPLLTRLITRYGYSVPRVTKENALTVTLLVRLTPGPPYALQTCLLGLAEVPFWTYWMVSWLAQVPWIVGGVVLGKGLLSGNFKLVAFAIGLLVVAIVLVQWVRRRLAARADSTARVSEDRPPVDLER